MARKLKKGTILTVTDGDPNLILSKYEEIFGKNSEGKIVILNDDTVEKDGNDFYYYDDKGRRHLIDEINKQSRKVVENKEEDTEEGQEETNINEGEEIYEDDDAEEEVYKYEEDEIEEKSDRRNQGYTKFDGKTFYYFSKPKKKDAQKYYDIRKYYKSKKNIGNEAGNKINIFKNNDNRRIFHYNNPSNNNNDPMNNRMLGDRFDEFVNAVNESKALSIEKGKVKNVGEFKYKYLNKINDCKLLFYADTKDKKDESSAISFFSDKKYIKAPSGGVDLTPMYLNKSDDRARLINEIDDVMKYISDDLVINRQGTYNPIRKIKPLSAPCCLRYVSYAALGDVLQECADMKYSDIGTEEADETYKKVENLTKALSLSTDESTLNEEHGGKKKEAFLNALRLWKDRYEEVLKLQENDQLESVINNEQAKIGLYENNRKKGPFTSI